MKDDSRTLRGLKRKQFLLAEGEGKVAKLSICQEGFKPGWSWRGLARLEITWGTRLLYNVGWHRNDMLHRGKFKQDGKSPPANTVICQDVSRTRNKKHESLSCGCIWKLDVGSFLTAKNLKSGTKYTGLLRRRNFDRQNYNTITLRILMFDWQNRQGWPEVNFIKKYHTEASGWPGAVTSARRRWENQWNLLPPLL